MQSSAYIYSCKTPIQLWKPLTHNNQKILKLVNVNQEFEIIANVELKDSREWKWWQVLLRLKL